MIGFLFRHFNDIDHVAPIAYRLLKDGKAPVGLFAMNPSLALKGDHRLDFLRRRFGTRAVPIYAARGPPAGRRLLGATLARSARIARRLGGATAAYADRIDRRLGRLWTEDASWGRAFLKEHDIEALVIDHGAEHRFAYRTLADAAKDMGVPTVGVPHGLDLMTHDGYLGEGTAAKEGARRIRDKYGWYDHLVVASPSLKQKYVDYGIPAGKIHSLGSARFCKEWLGVLEGITPAAALQRTPGRLHVVYMDHSPEYGLDQDAIHATFQKISQLNFVDLVIRKSTRVPLSDARLSQFARIDATTPSTRLIEWSDVVVTTISSIALEAYQRNKVLLHPRYFHPNKVIWDDLEACWGVRDRDAFVEALRRIHEDPANLPYSRSSVEDLWRHVVQGGHDDPDVLGRYAEFLLNVARDSLPPRAANITTPAAS